MVEAISAADLDRPKQLSALMFNIDPRDLFPVGLPVAGDPELSSSDAPANPGPARAYLPCESGRMCPKSRRLAPALGVENRRGSIV